MQLLKSGNISGRRTLPGSSYVGYRGVWCWGAPASPAALRALCSPGLSLRPLAVPGGRGCVCVPLQRTCSLSYTRKTISGWPLWGGLERHTQLLQGASRLCCSGAFPGLGHCSRLHLLLLLNTHQMEQEPRFVTSSQAGPMYLKARC